MPESMSLDEILEKNPHIDRDLLEQFRAFVAQHHKAGRTRSQYNLVPPYGGKRVFVADRGSSNDARTIRLSQRAS